MFRSIFRTALFRKSVLPLGGLFCAVLVCSCAATGSYSARQQQRWGNNGGTPPLLKSLYEASRLFIAHGEYEKGANVLRWILTEEPECLPAYSALAELRLRQNRVDEAIEQLQKGLKVSPRDPVFLNDLGVCYLHKGDYQEALYRFSCAALKAPQNPRYLANVDFALDRLEQNDAVSRPFEQELAEVAVSDAPTDRLEGPSGFSFN